MEKYGKTTTEDREDNWQRMAADWHPSDGFEPLATRLFIGASYASAACYPMDDRDVIDIGLRVIKRCGMYSEEYKNWIVRENKTPPIVKSIDSFKGESRTHTQPERDAGQHHGRIEVALTFRLGGASRGRGQWMP